MNVSLNYILKGFAAPIVPDVNVTGLSLDSNNIKKGYAFVALSGQKTHGLNYAEQALANGASAVIFEGEQSNSFIKVDKLSQHISTIAGRFYNNPSDKITVIAVTGTNGKSSVVYGLTDLLNATGNKAAVVGTLGYGLADDKMQTASHTTPDAIRLQELLANFVAQDVKFVAMEASSHGLVLHRLAGVRVDTAVFTNISPEHQDFHRSMDAYELAKEQLFAMESVKNALINYNDKFGRHLIKKYKDKMRVVSYGIDIGDNHPAEYLNASKVTHQQNGMSFELSGSWGKTTLTTDLVGKFNIENLLAIIGVWLLSGGKLDDCAALSENIRPVTGRMQSFGGQGQPLVVVDYAHTPDALQQALQALAFHKKTSQLICVFGCGGDRDKTKRPLMGKIAARYADQVILTDDNPRHESPATIIEDILSGIEAQAKVKVIPQRTQAIQEAIKQSATDDIILIAGKGHETKQIIGDESKPFSDQQIVQECL